MHKAQRLIHLIMKVNERKKFTLQEMADECGVSRRTMMRDLMELSELGVPLYSEVGPNGGYRVLRDKVLPPISFTESEALALFFAGQSLRNYKALPFNNEAEAALDKFLHYLSSELKQKIFHLRQRLLFSVAPHELETPCLQSLLDAALEQQVITIFYEASSSSERMIQPLGIYTINGLWYCQAYCFLANDYRTFRIDRVKSVSVSDDQSMRIDLSHQHIEDWIMHTEEEDTLELEVHLTAEGVLRCQSELWLAKSIQLQADGSGIIMTTMKQSWVSWAAKLFLGFGTDAHVIRPIELRQHIQSQLIGLNKQYSV